MGVPVLSQEQHGVNRGCLLLIGVQVPFTRHEVPTASPKQNGLLEHAGWLSLHTLTAIGVPVEQAASKSVSNVM